MNTTTAAVTEAMRAHHGDTRIGMPYTDGERRAVSIAVIESTRRFAIEHGHDDDDDPEHLGEARAMRDELDAMSADEWWAHEFVIHPAVFTFVHHLLQ